VAWVPGASANFYSSLISLAQKKYWAIQDTDFPEILLHSIGLKGFNETGIIDPNLVKKQLISMSVKS
jgi:hypothetical protein